MHDSTPSGTYLNSVIAAASFLGSLITLSMSPTLTKKQMILVVVSGVVVAYLGTPVIAAWVYSTQAAPWLPRQGSVEGLLGLFLGMGGIHLAVIFTSLLENFAKNPFEIIMRFLGK